MANALALRSGCAPPHGNDFNKEAIYPFPDDQLAIAGCGLVQANATETRPHAIALQQELPMLSFSSWRRFLPSLSPKARLGRRDRRPRRQKPSRRPLLERLEDRLAPAVINVNSTADILAPGGGVVTLRSAIQTANTNGDLFNTIHLTVAGTYAITRNGVDDTNTNGDFDILTAGGMIGLTIDNTSGAPAIIDGGNGGDRVFDVAPVGAAGMDVVIGNVNQPSITIQHGVAGTDGGGNDSTLTLNNCIVTNNICNGGAGFDGGGIDLAGTGSVTLNS
jgi:hypothetical protein